MPISEAQKRASIKYKNKNLKRVPLDLQIDDYERIKAGIEQAGYKSLNGFIKQAINEKLEREVQPNE